MIPYLLVAPIDYEQFYSTSETDDVQRFRALSVVIHRLKTVGWLGRDIHSINVIDWDWRTKQREYNHRHVPMLSFGPEILEWYREYGAFLHLDESRAQRFSLARFFFELSPRRDIVVITFDLSGEHLFEVAREECAKTRVADLEADRGTVFMPEILKIRMNRSLASSICAPLAGFLGLFRREHPMSQDERVGKIISLAQAIGDLKEPVSQLVSRNSVAATARDAYCRQSGQRFEDMGSGADRLMQSLDLAKQYEAKSPSEMVVRVLLANLAVQTFLLPDALQDSSIVIVPGMAQVRHSGPVVSGGLLLHCDTKQPNVDVFDWLLFATLWAREKATYDLVERNQRQEFGRMLHNISNKFGALIASVHSLSPAPKARGIANALSKIQSAARHATASVRGEAKNADHRCGVPGDFLPRMLKHAIESLAGNENVLNNLFGQAIEYQAAFDAIRDVVCCRPLPPELQHERVSFSPIFVGEVLDELVTNALEYTPWSNAPDSRVTIAFGLNGTGVYVEVTNAIGPQSVKHVESIAAMLKRRVEPEIVGIGLKRITIGCSNEGIPWPSIAIDSDKLRVRITCYLARREGRQ